ncbi:MAG TPA: O-antigen ligase family protein [Polyangiaceae bacterium]
MARRFTYLLIWLALTEEIEGEIFSGKWSTPLTTIGTAIFRPLPGIKLPFWDILMIGTLLLALGEKGAKTGRVKPVVKSIKLALGSIAALWMFGVVRGGDIRQTLWQLHPFVIAVVLAMLVMSTCRTPKHIATLGKVVLSAALYRAGVLFVFYYTIGRDITPPLEVMTTHADTVLFVTGMLIVIVNMLERRTLMSFVWMVVACVPLALAIKLNNRRLAWLSLGVGLGVSFWVLPKSPFKKKMNRAMIAAIPLLCLYVAAGWGKTSGIFKPVGAISTMVGKGENTSSEMRDIENYNLVQTLRTDPVLGTGWGHEYKEVSVAISIEKIFPQYRYIPHNSVLGLLAFSGLIGFALVWQLFIVGTYFHAIAVGAARTTALRTAAVVGFTSIVTFVFQMWGDMGWNTLLADVILATSLGVAGRLPVLAGAWPPAAVPAAGAGPVAVVVGVPGNAAGVGLHGDAAGVGLPGTEVPGSGEIKGAPRRV